MMTEMIMTKSREVYPFALDDSFPSRYEGTYGRMMPRSQ
jgi:hypothetical protein